MITSIALSGLRAASQELRTAGNNIANSTTPGYTAKEVTRTSLENGGVTTDVVDTNREVSLEEEVVQADIATYGFKANLKILEKQRELDKALFDIQA